MPLKPPETMSDNELLAYLMGVEENQIDLSLSELRNHPAIHFADRLPAKREALFRLAAAQQFAKRYHTTTSTYVRDAEEVWLLCRNLIRDRQETLFVIACDTNGLVLNPADLILYHGTVDQINIRVPEILRIPILYQATCYHLCHNHPGNDVTPSPADIKTTAKTKDLSNELGIPLIDHVVITTDKYQSINQWNRTHTNKPMKVQIW